MGERWQPWRCHRYIYEADSASAVELVMYSRVVLICDARDRFRGLGIERIERLEVQAHRNSCRLVLASLVRGKIGHRRRAPRGGWGRVKATYCSQQLPAPAPSRKHSWRCRGHGLVHNPEAVGPHLWGPHNHGPASGP